MLTDILAREYVQEQLRKANEERCRTALPGRRLTAGRSLRGLLGRNRPLAESDDDDRTRE
jgi:hypothetical protein